MVAETVSPLRLGDVIRAVNGTEEKEKMLAALKFESIVELNVVRYLEFEALLQVHALRWPSYARRRVTHAWPPREQSAGCTHGMIFVLEGVRVCLQVA